jgi:hypothetical protein
MWLSVAQSPPNSGGTISLQERYLSKALVPKNGSVRKRNAGECIDEKRGIHFRRFRQIFIKVDFLHFSTIGLINAAASTLYSLLNQMVSGAGRDGATS